MILVERGPASSHAPAEPARAGEPAPDVLEFPSARRLGWSLKVHYRNDERSRFRRLPGGWLYVASPTGLECFPDLAAIIDNAHFTGLPAALDALEHMRPAAFVAYDEQTEELQFGRSLDGFASLYFGGELPAIVIGESNFVVARRLGPIRFSKADEEAYCKNWSPGPEGSFLEGVTRCFAGVRYRLRPNRDSVERCLMAPDADLVDQDQAVILLRDEMRRICATYGNKRVALRLSGGVDSRVVLAGLMDAVREGILRRDQVLLTSVVFPGQNSDESPEISEVAQRSGFELAAIEVFPEQAAQGFDRSLQFDAPPFPTAFMGLMCVDEARRRGSDVMLSGHGGDEIFDFDLADVLGLPLSERLRQLALIRWFRDTRGLVGGVTALAQAVLGRRGLRGLRGTLCSLALSSQSFGAHRLGRRTAVALGYGYECAAVATARRAMYIDVPLFRIAWWSHFDSVACRRSYGSSYKAVAWEFIKQTVPDLAVVGARKVTFGATLGALLPDLRLECDRVDSGLQRSYATCGAYRAWRTRLEKRGAL